MTEPSAAKPRLVGTVRGPISFVDEGDGPVLLLVHGMPGSVRDFRWLTPLLWHRFRCVRVDLPGFGGTPAAALRGRGTAAHGAFLTDFLDALALKRVTVLGHSVGGAIALAMAALAPERVSRLAMLAAPGVRAHRAWRGAYPRASALLLRQPVLGRLLLPVAQAAFSRSGFPATTPPQAIYQALQFAGALDFDVQARLLAGLRLPTLVSWAEDDHLVEPAVAQQLGQLAPPGPRLTFPTGGHNIQKTRAKDLAIALCKWTD